MKKIKLSKLSILLSLLTLVLIIWLNFDIAQTYNSTDGKGRALFGILEFEYINYKILIGAIILIALGSSIFAVIKKDNSVYVYISFFLVILSSILIFLRFWKIFV
jgi:hypothetical protein